MDSTISVQPAEAPDSLLRARRAAWGSFAGAVVDWYDFLLYGITAALVFNREFFPQIGPAMGTLAAFATFGVGFLFRPLGGIIFGHFGDRLGRKRMLMMTVWMMGIATACIGLLPSFSQIGWWAPALLVFLRAVQGLPSAGMGRRGAALGGERPAGEKSLYSSGVQVGYGVGLLLSTGLVSLISSLTTDEQFLNWGWRLPFLFSVVLVLIALWIRNGMAESQEFEAQQSQANLQPEKKLTTGGGSPASPSGSVFTDYRPAAVRTADDVYRHRLRPQLFHAKPRPAARAVSQHRPAGGRTQLPDYPLLRLAGRPLWSPTDLYHRRADRHAERFSVLYGAGESVCFLDPVLRPDAGQYRP